MSVSVTQIRQALASKLGAITYNGKTLRAYYYVPGTIEPPCVVIVPGTFIPGDTVSAIHYDSTMANGSHDYVFTLQIVLSNAVDRTAQDSIDDYISPQGPQSVKATIEADMTLGVAGISFAHVQRTIQYGKITFNQVEYWGAQLVVQVTAT